MVLGIHERWLLEMVVELYYPLSVLGDPDIETHLNRPGHGLDTDEVAARLERLHAGGLISLIEHRGTDVQTAALTRDELRAEIEPRWRKDTDRSSPITDGVFFGLTAEGGRTWEAVARPRWERYLCDVYGEDDVEITAMDRAVIEAFLDGTRGPAWRDRAAGTWTALEPWHATYWKTLPSGVCYRFAAELAESLDDAATCGRWLHEFRRWFARVELPG